jgi:hypothetical protein
VYDDLRSLWLEYQSALKARDWESMWGLYSEATQEEFQVYMIQLKKGWREADPEAIDPESGAKYGELLEKDWKSIFAVLMTSLDGEEILDPDANWEFVSEDVQDREAFITFKDGDGDTAHMRFTRGKHGWRVAGMPMPGSGAKSERPGSTRSRSATALGCLKCICTGQEQFKTSIAIDLNTNGVGEYGFLSELGGLAKCRGEKGQKFEASPYIPRILGDCDPSGVSVKSGFCFIVYLPTGPSSATSTADMIVDTGEAETRWIAYAWPEESREDDCSMFMINEMGQPYVMERSTHVGRSSPPPWYEAFAAKGAKGWQDEIDETVWKPRD